MKLKIRATRHFLKEVKHLAKKYKSLSEDIVQLATDLQNKPSMGKDLGNGIHKIRMSISSKGKGKSGGARIITYMTLVKDGETFVFLLSIYDKSEKSTINDNEIKEIMKSEGLE